MQGIEKWASVITFRVILGRAGKLLFRSEVTPQQTGPQGRGMLSWLVAAVCLFAGRNMRVYLRDESAQTILRAATLR